MWLADTTKAETWRSWGQVVRADLAIPWDAVTNQPVSNGGQQTAVLGVDFQTFTVEPDGKAVGVNGTIYSLEEDAIVQGYKAVPVTFGGFPSTIGPPSARVPLFVNGNLLRLQNGMWFTTMYFEQGPACVVYAVRSLDGVTWNYTAVVADQYDSPTSGATESSSFQAEDGALHVVYRRGGGAGTSGFWVAVSHDNGLSFESPKPFLGQGIQGVEPRAVTLENGVTLVSGGRPGTFVWSSDDPNNASSWSKTDVIAHHNMHSAQMWHYNTSADLTHQSTSYTGLVALDANTALLCYDFLANGWDGPGAGPRYDAVFCTHVVTPA